MPTLNTLITFFCVSLLLAVTPGPDNLFVLVQSAQRGWRAGLAVVCGLCCGLLVQTGAVALGLASVFAASLTAFTVLKFVGAAYLIWLAWQALRPRSPIAATDTDVLLASDSAAEAARVAPIGFWRMARRGIVMNLTNPKIVIFFLAFLPQFADPSLGHVAIQIMVLGLIFMLGTLLVFGAIACFSGVFGHALLRSERAQRWLNIAAGLVFFGLALRLVTASR